MKEKLFKKDRGVSPVIGVILMVAITVILAAVIGAFVLGFQDQASERVPQASIGIDATLAGSGNDDGTINISHEGGEDVFNSDIRILVRNLTNSSAVSEWDPVSDEDAQILSTGDETGIDYNNDQPTINGSWDEYGHPEDDSDDIDNLSRNQRYRVMLIHDESGRVVADQTVTAR